MTNILIICGAILIFEIVLCAFNYANTKKKTENNVRVAIINNETERLKLYMNHDFDKIDSRIDKYIDEAGKTYKMNKFEYREADQLYLTEEMMNEMIKAITKDVMKKITPAVLALLQLSYNLDSKEDVISFLYEKIKIYVLTYSLETNADVQD